MPSVEIRALERWQEHRLFGMGELAPLLRDELMGAVMVNAILGMV